MEAASYPLMLVVASIFLSGIVRGSGTVSVKLVSYMNPGGKNAAGKCCDRGVLLTCGSRCDHIFSVCLNDPTSSDASPCSVGQFNTEVLRDQDELQFPDKIGEAENPFKIKFGSWASAIALKVTVKDDDEALNTTQLVEELQQTISVVPSKKSEYQEVVLRDRTLLVLKISVSCDDYYYGPGCTTFCKPSTGADGNYDCGSDGEKICREGWSGLNCDENMNDCLSSPCVHGTCQDLVNAYKCNCKHGFQGPNCDEADECSSAPCLNGGKCSDAFNSFSCSCPGGFAGEQCEVRTIPYACASNPCHEGATCQDVGASFNCVCPVERTGQLCETWIPHICDEKPCKNGGKCIRMGHAFRCVCSKGYYDVKCDRKIGSGAQSYKQTGAATSTSGSMTLTVLALPVLFMVR